MTPAPIPVSTSAQDGAPNRQTRFIDGEVLFAVLFALLLVFHLSMNLWWLGADNHTIRTDEEVHMQMARTYYQSMFLEHYDNPFQWLIAVSEIKFSPGFPVHPPLLHILGACIMAFFGYGVDNMALANTFTFIFLLVGVFFIARQFLDQWSALFTVFVVSFTPSIYADSRYMMTDYLAAALVVWAVYALLKSDRFRRTEWVFIFGIINGLAIMARTVAFLYYLLPSMLVVAAGAWLLLEGKRDKAYPDFGWRRLFFHCALTGVVTVGVFGPWYFHNLEYYYNYWMEQKTSVVRQIIPSDDVPPPQATAQSITTDAADSSATSGAESASIPVKAKKGFLERILHPRVEWTRYILYVINNSMFLPLFLLSMLGAIVSLLLPRFRSLNTLVLLAWVLGSYLFMTELFHFANPRYALAAVPALSILASLCVLAPSSPRWRGMCMGALAVLLFFTYGNLSIKDYDPYQRLEAPFVINPGPLAQFDDTGLVLYKAQLPQSDAFSVVGPPTQINFKDRFFMAMLQEEAKHKGARGEYANYLKLNTRGMEFDEQHYWPGSPFLRKDIPAELMPKRKFRAVGLGYEPEQLLPSLDNTDYIVYTIDVGEEEKELQWQEFFMERGFNLIERFRVERFGALAAAYRGVMAYKNVGETIQVGSAEDIGTLDLFDLYTVRQSANFKALAPALQQLVQTRFVQLVSAPPFGLNFPLCDEAVYMGVNTKRTKGGAYGFQMVFKAIKSFEQDFEIYFRVKPDAVHTNILSPEEVAQGYKEWKFEPSPATTFWPVGDYVIVTHQIEVPQGTYEINFGFQSETLGLHGQPVSLGWTTLGVSE